jgi:hypothetical protein
MFKFEFGRGKVSRELFNETCQKLGYNLPESFYQFIKNNDGAHINPANFTYYDYTFKNYVSNLVGGFLCINEQATTSITKKYYSPPEDFPKRVVPFSSTPNGDYICFDYRNDPDTDNPSIVMWNHEGESGEDISYVAKDFDSFLDMLYWEEGEKEEYENNIFRRLEKYFKDHRNNYYGKIDIDEVTQAEIALGINFNSLYPSFIEDYGPSFIKGYYIYGPVVHQDMPDKDCTVVKKTNYYKIEQKWPAIEDWYIISEDKNGNPIGINSTNGEVWLCDESKDYEKKIIAGSFEDFIRGLLDEKLEI